MPKNILKNQSGFTHQLLLILVMIGVGGLLLLTQAKVVPEELGKEKNVAGVFLARGDDDSNSGSSSSGGGSSGSGSSGSFDDDKSSDSSGSSDSSSGSGSSTSSSSSEKKDDVIPTTSSQPTTPKVKTKNNDNKQKTEVKFSEDEKIKIETRDDRTRIDVYQGGVKVRYEVRDGRVIIKAETEEGEGVSEEDLFKVVERIDKSDIKVATAGGELLLSRNNIGAISNFPLTIDLNTNQLIASTSAGTKVLTVLPDQAVSNMLAANAISKLNTQKLVSQVKQGGLASVSDVVTLAEKNGLPVYEISGLKDNRLLGFIPLQTEVNLIVSAETGQLVETQQSPLAQLIDLLSP